MYVGSYVVISLKIDFQVLWVFQDNYRVKICSVYIKDKGEWNENKLLYKI